MSYFQSTGKLLVKDPVPDPLVVFESAISGRGFVLLQQTPLAVTGIPPSKVILPPDTAVV